MVKFREILLYLLSSIYIIPAEMVEGSHWEASGFSLNLISKFKSHWHWSFRLNMAEGGLSYCLLSKRSCDHWPVTHVAVNIKERWDPDSYPKWYWELTHNPDDPSKRLWEPTPLKTCWTDSSSLSVCTTTTHTWKQRCKFAETSLHLWSKIRRKVPFNRWCQWAFVFDLPFNLIRSI